MTREKAIDIIKCLAWHTRPDEEDVEQAIKALEQERSRSAEITQYRHDCKKLMEENERLKKALEQEPFINKPCVSSGMCEHDKQKVLDKLRAEMLEEKECAYADFERYKVEYLWQDWEDVFDSLPHDDFRYGMERAIELIDKYKAESEVRNEA